MTPGAALDTLLAEGTDAARERGATAFDRVAAGRPVVLVGAGNLGRRVARAMAADGSLPVAFADEARVLHGTDVEGIPVTSAEAAVCAHADAVFVVTIWGARSTHRIARTEARLRELGVRTTAPFTHLMWKHRGSLPHYCVDLPERSLEQAEDIRATVSRLADDASRGEFEAQVTARVTGRFDRLGPPIDAPQYLAPGLVAPRTDEVVVDGGAFDGDSLRDWVAARGATFARWIAVEPDPTNAAGVARTAERLSQETRGRVSVVGAALGARPGAARLDGQGPGARVGAAATGAEVAVTTLDAVTAGAGASFVKLDIEGDELAALEGATRLLAEERPVLAICVYHRHDHLWRVPLFLSARAQDYDLFLRPHGAEGWDLVLYAVPMERRA